MRATCCPATATEMYSKGVPPTILYEYQNKELTKFAFCKRLILNRLHLVWPS